MQASSRQTPRSRLGWAVLIVALAVETLGGVILVVMSALRIDTSPSNDWIALDVSILLVLFLLWVWVVAVLFGAIRSRASWVRGSAVTIHVLIFAAGTGVLQGIMGTQALGWGLVLLSFVGFGAALIARPEVQEREGLDVE